MAGDAIKFNASLNTAGFESGAKKLQSVAAGAASGISQHFGKIAVAVAGIGAAFLGVRAAVQSFNAAIAFGGQLNDLSARTGETAGNLAILQRAFQNAGAGAEAVGPTINRLQRAIVEAGEGGKQQAKAFEKLGLNLEDIKRKAPLEQLQAVAKALQGVGNDSDRSAIAMQLLGRSGGELLPLLRAMGVELDTARGQLGSLPSVIDRTNAHLDRIGDNFKAIGEKGKEFMVGLLERLAPGLADLTDRLANIDAAGFGAKLSEYAEKTVSWIAETFKLNDALNNLEVAISGITSGNFGDGLKLMFLTARDTALNAINQIVAAAGAAIEVVGAAVSNMFRSNGPLILLLQTGFTIAASYLREALYNALADFMGAIGRMGMADKFRYEAETAARSIEMLTKGIGAQVELVGEDAKETFAGIPDAFAKSYKANMEKPLFDMKDRAAQTADQMERVAAATRAAAFDAEKFGQALRDAQTDRLAGISGGGESEMAQNRDGKNFPWQGAGPSGSQDSGGGGEAPTRRTTSAPAPKPQSNLELLRQQGQTDPRARAEMMRLQNEQTRGMDRAGDLRERGFFQSSARAEMRAERRAEERAEKFNARELATDRFGGRNMGESFRNFRNMMSEQGVFGVSQKDFESWAREQVKTEKEREREQSESGAGGAGVGAAASDPMNAITGQLSTIIQEITKRLPQNALAA